MADPANSPNPGTPDPQQPAPSSGGNQAPPSPFELGDDSLVKLKDAKEPVKFGEWYRGIQQKITKSGQERSEYAKQLDLIKREREAEQAEIQRLRTALGAPAQQTKAKPLHEGLKDLSYLDGRSAADVIGALEQRIAGFDEQIEVRDRALKLIATKLAENMQFVQGMTSMQQQAMRQARVKEAMKSLDMPEEALEMALDLYHSYEGDELDEKFPELLKQRWESVQGLIRGLDKRKVEAARRAKFVPGKGGDARPGLQQDLSRASAKETADALWDLVKSPEAT